MADPAVEDHGYSDEDLDTLPVNTLCKLQEDALQPTQQFRRVMPVLSSREQSHGPNNNAENAVGAAIALDGAAHPRSPQQPSSDYGDLDDEMLDGELFDGADPSPATRHPNSTVPIGEITQREQWRQHRYGGLTPNLAYQGQQLYSPHNVREPFLGPNILNEKNVVSSMQVQPLAEKATEPTSADVGSLQAHIQRLLSEREVLKQAILSSENKSLVKAGEIAMVREKILKVEQEFGSRTKAQQRLHADESARYRLEIEKARSDIQSISTEKAFLENELAEGSKKVRQVQKERNKGILIPPETSEFVKRTLPATPKKSKSSTYADGFNDDEVQILSPSKLALRRRTGTPKAGLKRKRRAVDDSPVKPQQLEFVEPVRHNHDDKGHEDLLSQRVFGNHQNKRQRDADLHFTRRLLNHRLQRSQERTIEVLSQFSLPSSPEKALSTLLYDQLLMLGETAKVEDLPVAVGLILISMWSQCLRERYYIPVHLLIDLLEFVILVTPIKTAPELTDSLMGLVQETADIVIIPRCQKKSPQHERHQITSLACLRVILTVAQDCSADAEEISRFWRTMRFDFTMMLLSFLHPLEELHIAVAILRTSVLEKSFAMIIPYGDGKQDVSEAHVIDNLSRLLVESPRLIQGEHILDPVQMCELRIKILGVLDAMCERQYCAEALAKHRLVLGRIVRVMNDELDKAYDYLYGHNQRIALINAATHVLYFLMSKYGHLIDVQARLSVIPGGEKKFLIVLTRLAFSEGNFLEGGITDEVVDEAHQLLEMRVSPEEAEQLVGAFASTQSIRLANKEPQ